MKISNKFIKIEMNQSLVDSIEYKGKEILNTTKKWTKKSPILFPAIGPNKEFKIKEDVYKIPKHGFWNDIEFDITSSSNGIILSGNEENASYPFYIEADQYILLDKNKITYTTTFTGQPIPMQFGYHPAFNYDLGGLKIKQEKINIINSDMTNSIMDIDINNISELPWDKVDTFIFKTNELVLENKEYNVIVKTNMDYIALWTNGDKYICIEPWSNLPALIIPDDNLLLNDSSFIMEIIIEEKDM